MMEVFSIESSFALLNSSFYLSFTSIPVKSRYGHSLLYNHKTKTTAFIDPKTGDSILSPGGIYTIEPCHSDLFLKQKVQIEQDPRITFIDFKNSLKFKEIYQKNSEIGLIPLTLSCNPMTNELTPPTKSKLIEWAGMRYQRSKSEKELIKDLRGSKKNVFGGLMKSSGKESPSSESIPYNNNNNNGNDDRDQVFELPESLQSREFFVAHSEQSSEQEIYQPALMERNSRTSSATALQRTSYMKSRAESSTDLVLNKNPGLLKKKRDFSINRHDGSMNVAQSNDEDEGDTVASLADMLASGPPPPPMKKTSSNSSINSNANLPMSILKKKISNSHFDLGNQKVPEPGQIRNNSMADVNGTSDADLADESGYVRPSPLRKKQSLTFSPTKEKFTGAYLEELYAAFLKVYVLDPSVKYLVRLTKDSLLVFENEDFSLQPIIEISLMHAVARTKRHESSFPFTVWTPAIELTFDTTSYVTMLCFVAVINSVSSSLSVVKEPLIQPSVYDMHVEIFDREHYFLIMYIESLNNSQMLSDPEFERIVCDNIENFSHSESLYRISSDGESIKYDNESQPKLPFNIAGATIDKLIERMTDLYGPDYIFVDRLLYSYRAFSDGNTILKKMILRMDVNIHSKEPNAFYWKAIIKLRTIMVVIRWMALIWKPDFSRKAIRDTANQFFNHISIPFVKKDDPDSLNQRLDSLYLKKFEAIHTALKNLAAMSLPYITPPKAVEEKKKSLMAVLDLDADDLANAITKKDQASMNNISAISLFLHLWESQKDPLIVEMIAPINSMVDHFNNLSYWVATEICTQPDIKNRVKVVEKIIKIAEKTFSKGNFNTTLAIVSGLNLVSVSRLKATWELVDSKRMKQLQALEDIMSPSGNYKAYRAAYEERDQTKPCIPVLSLLLKDLLFQNDGNPTYLNDPNDKTQRMINMSKFQTICSRILEFTSPNQPKYQIDSQTPSTMACEELSNNLRALKEQSLYKYSCLCEPKQGDSDALRLRAKWTATT